MLSFLDLHQHRNSCSVLGQQWPTNNTAIAHGTNTVQTQAHTLSHCSRTITAKHTLSLRFATGLQSEAGTIFSSPVKIQSCHNTPARARQANWICGDWYRVGMTVLLTWLNLSRAFSQQPWPNKSNVAVGLLYQTWAWAPGSLWHLCFKRNSPFSLQLPKETFLSSRLFCRAVRSIWHSLS